MQSAHYFSAHQDEFLLKMSGQVSQHSAVMSNANQSSFLRGFYAQLAEKFPGVSSRSNQSPWPSSCSSRPESSWSPCTR